MIVTLVAAVADNAMIGRDGGLPWHLPDDLKHFKRVTSGHTVIMGRRTIDEVGAPLPNRRNLVITRNRDFTLEGVEVVHGLDEALARSEGEQEVFVIGGAQIYAAALPRADRMVLTRVHVEPQGDTVFPEVAWEEWQRETADRHFADDRHAHGFTIEVWRRTKGS